MSQFITPEDYDASIHREILSSLLREKTAGGTPNPDYNPQVLEVCEDQAIAEMRSYMETIYDCDAIFSTTREERHPLVLMFAKDITIYHIFSLYNPYKIADIRKDRYERAIEWLKGIAKGTIAVGGLPRLPEEQTSENSPWQITADKIRPTLL